MPNRNRVALVHRWRIHSGGFLYCWDLRFRWRLGLGRGDSRLRLPCGSPLLRHPSRHRQPILGVKLLRPKLTDQLVDLTDTRKRGRLPHAGVLLHLPFHELHDGIMQAAHVRYPVSRRMKLDVVQLYSIENARRVVGRRRCRRFAVRARPSGWLRRSTRLALVIDRLHSRPPAGGLPDVSTEERSVCPPAHRRPGARRTPRVMRRNLAG